MGDMDTGVISLWSKSIGQDYIEYLLWFCKGFLRKFNDR